jgi:hypothetical protein
MAAAGITGHVRTLDRQGGKVFYAKLKIAKPDGTTFEPQRRLGKVWTRRTRPPEGHLTRRMADARLEAILAGDDPLVNVDVPSDVVTLGQACDEHLRYLEFDRQRKPSYVKDCRSMVHCYLLPAFGESLPVTAITTADVDRLRDRLLSTPRARRLENGSAPPIAHKTAQKVLVLLGGILGRGEAQGLDHDEPVRGRRKGQRQAIRRVQRAERRASPRRRACRRRRAARGADRRGGVHRLAPGRACSRCAGVTSTSATGSSTCGATWRRARRRRTRRRRTAFAACRFPIRRWWRSTG